jgi:hypothetical protein
MIEGDKMTEETNLDAVEASVEVESETTPDDTIKAETLFFVVKGTDCSFRALTDVSTKVEIARPAGINDIRIGCNEIARAIDARHTADTVVAMLAAASRKQEQQA